MMVKQKYSYSVVLPMLLSAKPLKSVSVEVLRLGGWGETAPLPLNDRWAGGTGETCLGAKTMDDGMD